ncbi:MAG: nucleoside kinase [Lachnospiraceae bacterium]|nr:nucleoside kinase [Lachnospiraceae bacterium]
MATYTLNFEGELRTYSGNHTWEDVAKDFQDRYDAPIAAVSDNGKIRELFKKVDRDSDVSFFTLKDVIGHKTYVRAATMLLIKAIQEIYGADVANHTIVDFAVGNGLFVNPEGGFPVSGEIASQIKEKMQELVERDIPYMKRSLPVDDAIALFESCGMEDKVKLFKYRRSSRVNIYELDGYYDYFYGYMLPRTGYVKYFDFIAYCDGYMLLLPERKTPTVVDPFRERKKLYETFMTTHHWCNQVGIKSVGSLNDRICKGGMNDLILVQEAEQERRIGEIAKQIASRGNVKFVMIAGPSSSGKTSFSHRLSIQLRTLGLKPHPVAVDDYFVNREDTPLDEDGNYNFECIEAIDTAKFNEDMLKLLNGERVEIPSFNFKIGRREYNGNFLQLEEDDILVIEGIHGLNEKMSYALPNESKFKIYISALTSINVDAHNRIATTDARLLRRMVRDARTRGSDAKRTLGMWASVRRGEEENIFPFQEEADAMFNSAMVFELALLKPFAEPLLFEIGKDEPEYYEAKRLLKFLDYFLSVPSEFLPNNSICREFVGGSCFRV